MRLYFMYELVHAYLYAEDGGQALHWMSRDGEVSPRSPAHLIDNDERRLIATARALGVRTVKVERRGAVGQHVDLWGKPLERAIRRCERVEPVEKRTLSDVWKRRKATGQ